MAEMMDIHREMPSAASPLYIYRQFSTREIASHIDAAFLDFEEGKVDFNNDEFVGLISYVKENTDPARWDILEMLSLPLTPSDQILLSERYLFHKSFPLMFQFFLDYEQEQLFAGLIPVVTTNGELLIWPSNDYVLNANATSAQQKRALDFIMFMAESDREGQYHGLLQPTNRNTLRFAVEHLLPHEIQAGGLMQHLAGTFDEAVEAVIAKMTTFAEMPMHSMSNVPSVIRSIERTGIIPETMQLFEDGLISADETAANLQNQVELVMMEIGGR